MPRWVAQQWHVLRVTRSAGNVLGCARRPGVAPLRTFAQRTAQDAPNKTLAPSTRNSAIIIPSCIQGIQPRDLIAAIQPIEPVKCLTHERLAVFFLTPAFAQWLLDDETFLGIALQRVFEKVETVPDKETIHALVAVVDKLPTPRAIEDLSIIEEEVLHTVQTPPVTDTGHEGLSYTTLSYSDFQYTARGSLDEHGVVNFLITNGSNKESSFCGSLRLPLANTIFQTGSPTTMILSAWVKQEHSKELKLKSRIDLSGVDMKLPRDINVESPSALAVPLIPVTVPRMIEAGMGNILRRITGPDGKSVPASEELEKVVPEYFKARSEPARSISVWALLIPKHIVDELNQTTEGLLAHVRRKESNTDPKDVSSPWNRLWKSDPPIWNDLVTSALSKGARLHRVLSGGGGWGKKAGLLSLDPSAMSEDIATSSTQETPFAEKEAGDLSAALQEVMRPGDSIQFFASPTFSNPSASSPAKTIDSLEILQKSHMRTPWMWEFGMVPSTSDAIQASTWQHHTPTSKNTFVFRNTFGALSEGGLTLKRQDKLQGGDPRAVVGPTKIDVPFSRFSSVNLKDGMDEEKRVSGVELLRKIREADIFQRNDRFSTVIDDDSVPLLSALPDLQISTDNPDRTRTLSQQILDGSALLSSTLRKIPKNRLLHGSQFQGEEHTVSSIREYRHNPRFISKMANEIEKAALLVRQLGDELTHIIGLIWFRAVLIAAVNNSAVNTYLLHTFLRWQLAAMISSRQGLSPFKTSLTKRLKHLRSFNKTLFMKSKAPTVRFVAKQLKNLEAQQPLIIQGAESNAHMGQRFRDTEPLSMWEMYRGQLDRSLGPSIRDMKARPQILYFLACRPPFRSTPEPENGSRFVRFGSRKSMQWSKRTALNRDTLESDDEEPEFSRFRITTPSSPIQPSPNGNAAVGGYVVGENERDFRDVDKRPMIKKSVVGNRVRSGKFRKVVDVRPDITTEGESKAVEQLTHRKREARRELLKAVGGWLGGS